MNLVCLDNHILVWGIKEEATKGQEEMIPRAKAYIQNLDETNTKALIPSIIVGEFLLRIPPNLHALVTNLFNKNFIIGMYDVASASKFSEIWQAKKDVTAIKELIENGKTRAELRADSMIVATAVSHKADYICSHDAGIKAFAQGYIDVKEIPFIPQQTNMLTSS